MRRLILGADGGGTKTSFAAYDMDRGCVIGTSRSGGINLGFSDRESVLRHIREGIQALGLEASDRICAVSIGDPALDDTGTSPKHLEKALRQAGLFSGETLLLTQSDVFMALYALSDGGSAALVVAGTGSMAAALPAPYRHGEANEILTVGGWGGIAPDRGSGYDIASSALFAAMDAFDGIADETALCEEAMRFFEVEKPRMLIGRLGEACERAQIAAFARRVDQLAEDKDPVACRIIERAGRYLGAYAISLLRKSKGEIPLVGVYGSVLTGSRGVREAFEREVSHYAPGIRICVPSKSPEMGAIQFALDALSERGSGKAAGRSVQQN